MNIPKRVRAPRRNERKRKAIFKISESTHGTENVKNLREAAKKVIF